MYREVTQKMLQDVLGSILVYIDMESGDIHTSKISALLDIAKKKPKAIMRKHSTKRYCKGNKELQKCDISQTVTIIH